MKYFITEKLKLIWNIRAVPVSYFIILAILASIYLYFFSLLEIAVILIVTYCFDKVLNYLFARNYIRKPLVLAHLIFGISIFLFNPYEGFEIFFAYYASTYLGTILLLMIGSILKKEKSSISYYRSSYAIIASFIIIPALILSYLYLIIDDINIETKYKDDATYGITPWDNKFGIKYRVAGSKFVFILDKFLPLRSYTIDEITSDIKKYTESNGYEYHFSSFDLTDISQGGHDGFYMVFAINGQKKSVQNKSYIVYLDIVRGYSRFYELDPQITAASKIYRRSVYFKREWSAGAFFLLV